MKQLTKKSMIYTITGIIFALIIFYLTFTGNPKNMGVCVGCFIRDTSGAVNLHNAKAFQYIRPEIIGMIFGSFIVSENNYAIKGIQLRMAPHVNINFVKKIEINQDFDFVDQQFWMMTNDYLLVEFSPLEKMPAVPPGHQFFNRSVTPVRCTPAERSGGRSRRR